MERFKKVRDSGLDLVSHTADEVETLSSRIGKGPILMTGPRVVGAHIATTHRNYDIALTDDVISPELRLIRGDVDSDFSHCLDCGSVRFRRRIRTTRKHHNRVASEMAEPTRCHLRTARVVDTHEQHGRPIIRHILSLHDRPTDTHNTETNTR